MNEELELAVFPLEDLVFFPNTSIPLRIFEPRYQKMLDDCLETGLPMAVTSWDPTDSQPEGSSLKKRMIAGYGHPQVMGSQPDGARIILLHGRGKVALGEQLQNEPYLRYKAQVVPDQTEVDPRYVFLVKRMERVLSDWTQKQIKGADEETRHAHEEHLRKTLASTPQLVEVVSALLIEDTDLKQELLERDNINDRITLLTTALSAPGMAN